MKMSDVCNVNMKTISTGILPLDVALGIGGLPRGKIIEICGSENSGKTTLALHIIAEMQRNEGIAEMQRNEGTAVFIDAEHALDPAYTKKLGVNLDKLLVSRPNTGEECLGIVNSLISSGTVDMIVIDSIPALAPKIEFEIENTIDYNFMGFRARMMIRALRMFTFAVKHTDIVIIFINSIRKRKKVMYEPTEHFCNKKIKSFFTIRLEVRKGEAIKNGTEIVGNRVKIKVAKNKFAPTSRTAEFDLVYGKGFPDVLNI